MAKVLFAAGAHVPAGAEPVGVKRALDNIRRRHGELSAKAIADDVEQDEVGSHPLRPWFTWDAVEGMRKLHVIEAARLIRAIVVTDLVSAQHEPVRAYVLSSAHDGSYQPISAAIKVKSERAALIEQVDAEWAQFDNKRRELMALIRLLAQ